MKTRIRLNISPAAIAIALFCAVAIFTPTLTSTDITRKDSPPADCTVSLSRNTPGYAAMTIRYH